MRPGEEIFTEIIMIRDEKRVSLSEAVVEYAESADCDVEDILKALDPPAIKLIRESLQESILLRPSMRVKKSTAEIDFG